MVFSLSPTGLIAQELLSEHIRHNSVRPYQGKESAPSDNKPTGTCPAICMIIRYSYTRYSMFKIAHFLTKTSDEFEVLSLMQCWPAAGQYPEMLSFCLFLRRTLNHFPST